MIFYWINGRERRKVTEIPKALEEIERTKTASTKWTRLVKTKVDCKKAINGGAKHVLSNSAIKNEDET